MSTIQHEYKFGNLNKVHVVYSSNQYPMVEMLLAQSVGIETPFIAVLTNNSKDVRLYENHAKGKHLRIIVSESKNTSVLCATTSELRFLDWGSDLSYVIGIHNTGAKWVISGNYSMSDKSDISSHTLLVRSEDAAQMHYQHFESLWAISSETRRKKTHTSLQDSDVKVNITPSQYSNISQKISINTTMGVTCGAGGTLDFLVQALSDNSIRKIDIYSQTPLHNNITTKLSAPDRKSRVLVPKATDVTHSEHVEVKYFKLLKKSVTRHVAVVAKDATDRPIFVILGGFDTSAGGLDSKGLSYCNFFSGVSGGARDTESNLGCEIMQWFQNMWGSV